MAIAESDLLGFYGRPHLFLGLSILVYRDTKDMSDRERIFRVQSRRYRRRSPWQ